MLPLKLQKQDTVEYYIPVHQPPSLRLGTKFSFDRPKSRTKWPSYDDLPCIIAPSLVILQQIA